MRFLFDLFPRLEKMIEMYDINDKRIDSIKTSPNKALEAFLQANAAKDVLQMLK